MAKITQISAKEISDSKGSLTIEAGINLDDGKKGRASIPSGVSTEKYEARPVEADLAVKEIKNVVSLAVLEKFFESQGEFDEFLKKLNVGANVSLAVSIAFCRANGSLQFPPVLKLPQIMTLIFEGGKHSSGSLLFQEYMILTNSAAESYSVYKKAGQFLDKKGIKYQIGLEGGYGLKNTDDKTALKLLTEIINGQKLICLDVAASSLKGRLDLNLSGLPSDFPIFSIEDPFTEEQENLWKRFNKKWGKQILVIGDDLLATSVKRIKEAAEKKLVNAAIIKPNQQRTLTDALAAVKTAKENGLKIIVSHRGRETDDPFIIDLALSVEADFVKIGSPSQKERIAKYERLAAQYG